MEDKRIMEIMVNGPWIGFLSKRTAGLRSGRDGLKACTAVGCDSADRGGLQTGLSMSTPDSGCKAFRWFTGKRRAFSGCVKRSCDDNPAVSKRE